MADCPTFWACKTGIIFNHWGIMQVPKERATILKSWCSEMPFLVFWENNFCLIYLLNRLPFLCLFLFARCQVQVILFYILRPFFMFSGYHVQLRTLWTLGVCIRIHLKIPELMSKSGFFLSYWHIGLDFQAKSGEYQWNQDGWTVCCLLDCWTISWLAPPCVSLGMCFVMLNHGWINTQGL